MYHKVTGKTQTQGHMTHVSCFRQLLHRLNNYFVVEGKRFSDLSMHTVDEASGSDENYEKYRLKKNRSTGL